MLNDRDYSGLKNHKYSPLNFNYVTPTHFSRQKTFSPRLKRGQYQNQEIYRVNYVNKPTYDHEIAPSGQSFKSSSTLTSEDLREAHNLTTYTPVSKECVTPSLQGPYRSVYSANRERFQSSVPETLPYAHLKYAFSSK
jgi:hypothetical protein